VACEIHVNIKNNTIPRIWNRIERRKKRDRQTNLGWTNRE